MLGLSLAWGTDVQLLVVIALNQVILTMTLAIFFTSCTSNNTTASREAVSTNPPTPTAKIVHIIIESKDPPRLGIVVDQTFTIVHIEPGSAAEAASLQNGDILLSLNQIPFTKDANAMAQIKSLVFTSQDKALALSVGRNGKDMALQIIPGWNKYPITDGEPKIIPTNTPTPDTFDIL